MSYDGRVQYAYIEGPKTAQAILIHPKALMAQALYLK